MCFTIIEICAKHICNFRNDAKGLKDIIWGSLESKKTYLKTAKIIKKANSANNFAKFLSPNIGYFDR